MTDRHLAQLDTFRAIADAMHASQGARDWQWLGPYMSQRYFGITEERAKAFAALHGGEAKRMEAGQ